MNILIPVFGWITTIASAVFVIVSVILFIRERIAAKREGRKTGTKYIAMFVVGMTIAGCWLMIFILLEILSYFVMRSM